MAENRQFHPFIQNRTRGRLSLESSSLSWGKFTTSPMSQIARETFPRILVAKGTKDTATGTEGNVVYVADDGTKFTIYWDVSYSGTNSGSFSCSADGGRCSAYSLREGKWENGRFVEVPFPNDWHVSRYYLIRWSAKAISVRALEESLGCDVYGEKEIRGLVTSEYVTLQDFFDVRIPDADKVRGIVDAAFLEHSDLRGLIADFGERALDSLSAGADSSALRSSIDLYRRCFIDRSVAPTEMDGAQAVIAKAQESGISASGQDQKERDRDQQVLNVLEGMWADDPVVAAYQTLDRVWRLRGTLKESKWQMARIAELFQE